MTSFAPATATVTTVWDTIDDLLDAYDGVVRIECASRCAWSGEIRLTLSEPEGAPARRISFQSIGGALPETVAERLLADVRAWLATSDVKPLPAPPWMVG
jgi:hypothetical protein